VTTVLDLVLRHNAWANKTLLEHCATLGLEALDLEAPGTYGTLRATLQHVVGGEQFYMLLLTGERLGASMRGRRATLDELRATAALTGARALEVAAQDDPDRVIEPGDEETTVGIVLAQLVHHGNEHRAQATTILGTHGQPTPKIGAWSYGIASGISKNDGD
jgi:uncharacterized damage-inducible protein DinB